MMRVLLAITFLLFFSQSSSAQWTQLHAPGNPNVTSLHQFGEHLILYTADSPGGLIYHAEGEVRVWESVQNPIFNLSGYIPRFGYDSTYLYLFQPDYGLYRTLDWGAQWETVAPPQAGPNFPTSDDLAIAHGFLYYNVGGSVLRLETQGGTQAQEVLTTQVAYPDMIHLRTRGKDVWAAATDSLLRTSDDGMSWDLVWEGEKIKDFEIAGDTIVIKTAVGYWNSVNYGVDWSPVSSFEFGDNLSYSDGTWFAGKIYTSGLYRSTDAGLNWQVMFDSTQLSYAFSTHLKKGNRILLNGAYGPVISRDNGSSWAYECNGLQYIYSNSQPEFRQLDQVLFLNDHFSTDNGQTWTFPVRNNNFLQHQFFTTCAFGGSIYGINRKFELWRSDSDLTNWQLLPLQMPQNSIIYLTSSNTNLCLMLPDGMYESTDQGQNWVYKGSFLASKATGHKNALYYLGNKNGDSGFQNLYKSVDGGSTWIATAANVAPYKFIETARIVSTGQNLYIHGGRAILVSTDDGESFVQVNNNLLENISGFPLAANAFAATDSMIAITDSQGFYFSPNSLSDQWVSLYDGINASLPPYFTAPLFVSDTLFLAGKEGIRQLWKRPTNSIQTFRGTVYFDQNNNGLKDPNEPPMPRATLYRQQDNFSMTGNDGKYALSVESPGDTLRLVQPSPHAVINPPYYLVQQEASGQDFGVHLSPDVTDMRISLTSEGVFRPGFSNRVFIHYSNLGGDTILPKIRFFVTPALSIISLDPQPSTAIGDTLIWEVPEVYPLGSGSIFLNFQLNPNAPLGNTVQVFASLETTQADIDLSNNADTLNEIIVGSFDPNDKTCLNGDLITPEEASSRIPLEYIIRFQNTGSYYAEIVRLSDQLHENLDPTTFEFIGSSHPCQVSIREGGKLEFLFTGIKLPPTSQNEPESHGFVRFKVQPKAGLVLEDSIPNQAAIYFDFNAPIITNTALTLVNEPSSANEPEDRPRHMVPNPASDLVQIDCKSNAYVRLRLLDNLGRPVQEINKPIFPVTVNIAPHPKGVYWVEFTRADGQVFFEKLLVQ